MLVKKVNYSRGITPQMQLQNKSKQNSAIGIKNSVSFGNNFMLLPEIKDLLVSLLPKVEAKQAKLAKFLEEQIGVFSEKEGTNVFLHDYERGKLHFHLRLQKNTSEEQIYLSGENKTDSVWSGDVSLSILNLKSKEESGNFKLNTKKNTIDTGFFDKYTTLKEDTDGINKINKIVKKYLIMLQKDEKIQK